MIVRSFFPKNLAGSEILLIFALWYADMPTKLKTISEI